MEDKRPETPLLRKRLEKNVRSEIRKTFEEMRPEILMEETRPEILMVDGRDDDSHIYIYTIRTLDTSRTPHVRMLQHPRTSRSTLLYAQDARLYASRKPTRLHAQIWCNAAHLTY